MSRSGGIKPWPAVFQRKRNAAYLLRPCLPLATYPFTTIWIPWKAFLANYTAAAGARVPDNTPRLASVSLGERVISSTSVALPGHTNRGPVTRIEPWEEYHGMTRVLEFRHGIHGIHAFSTSHRPNHIRSTCRGCFARLRRVKIDRQASRPALLPSGRHETRVSLEGSWASWRLNERITDELKNVAWYRAKNLSTINCSIARYRSSLIFPFFSNMYARIHIRIFGAIVGYIQVWLDRRNRKKWSNTCATSVK